MINNTLEYILCAAIERKIVKDYNPMYHNNDILDIEIGYRHHDILTRFKGEVDTSPHSQGFYTSKGRYVNRKEGLKIAIGCGQVIEGKTITKSSLCSEDLY